MSSIYLTHARLILPDTVLYDSALLIDQGRIQAIEPDRARADQVIDLAGQTVAAGLVDLHCDAVEKEVEPRAKVLFPLDFAVAQIDRRNAAAGITTPYHAVSFESQKLGVRHTEAAEQLIRAIARHRPHSLVDNRVHCRYEITDVLAMPVVRALLEEGLVDLFSVMDHTPGQGQFKSVQAYLDYQTGNHGITHEEAQAILAQKYAGQVDAAERIVQLLQWAKQHGIPTASHDDDSEHRVAAMQALGVAISEFPINFATARTASERGLPTVLGAPNVLRGRSQSGSMRAIDAIEAGVLSCLCSDYQPAALIAAAFAAARETDLPLHQALALVNRNPAQAVGLNDRGHIAPGLRADLIAIADVGGQPLISHTWCAGKLVFSAHYPQNALASSVVV